MPILDPSHYREVRAAIDVNLRPARLADTVIGLDLYQGEAERWAMRLDPLYEQRAGAELRQLQTAVVLKTASLLIRALPQLIEESFRQGENLRRQPVDVEKAAEALAQRAIDAINGYLSPETPAAKSLPTMFDVAPGRRGF